MNAALRKSADIILARLKLVADGIEAGLLNPFCLPCDHAHDSGWFCVGWLVGWLVLVFALLLTLLNLIAVIYIIQEMI